MMQWITIEKHGPFANKEELKLMGRVLSDDTVNGKPKDILSEWAICLPIILTALRWQGSEQKIKEAIPYKHHNLEENSFLETMANLGFGGNSVSLAFQDIDECLLPCIFIPDAYSRQQKKGLQHAVVLTTELQTEVLKKTSISGMSCKQCEPIFENCTASGKVIFFKRLNKNSFFAKDAEFRLEQKNWFEKISYRFEEGFKQFFLASLVRAFLALAFPLFTMLLFDKVLAEKSVLTLYHLSIGLTAAILISFILRYLQTKNMTWFAVRLDNIVNKAVFEKWMFFKPHCSEEISISAQVAQLSNIKRIRQSFICGAFLTCAELPSILIMAVALMLIAGELVFVPLVICGVYIGLALITGPRLKYYIKQAEQNRLEQQEIMIESFNKLDCIRYSGAESAWLKRCREISGEAEFSKFKANYLQSIIELIAERFLVISGLGIVYFGVEKIWSEELTPGGFAAAFVLSWYIVRSLKKMCMNLTNRECVAQSMNHISNFMENTHARPSNKVTPKMPQFLGEVTFSSVALKYNKEQKPILSDLSFKVKPGEIVVINGDNGVGKSTVLKLLNGMHSPERGTIRIDGMDTRQFDPVDLRQSISYLPQQPWLFQDTILRNVKLSSPLVRQAEVEAVLRDVGIWHDIKNMPNGLLTEISKQECSGLSGELNYKIAMARAYVNERQIMMFDELPYSILNSEVGLTHRRYIEKLKGKRTIFMVSHRQDFIDLADVVITLFSESTPLVSYPGRENY